MDINQLIMILGGGGGGGSSIVSIQYVEIALSGVNSNTATISAVNASRSFLVYAGSLTSATNSAHRAQGRAVITSSTVVTAYRNDSSQNNSWCGYVVEMDSGTIDAVEFGTVSLGTGDSSQTATLSGSFTTTQSAVFFLGQESTSTSTTNRMTAVRSRIKLTNATTVTAYKTQTGTDTGLVVGFVAVKFNSSKIASVQHVECNETGTNTSWNATISSVSTANCLVAYGGSTNTGSNNNGNYTVAGALTGATTVTGYTNTTASQTKYFNCVVIEFNSGVINSNQNVVEAGLAGSASTSVTETISTVSAPKSIVGYMGVTYNTASATWAHLSVKTTLTASTTVTTERTGTSSVTDLTAYARVTEFV